ncbi:MAG: hypothetical protein HKN04_10205 [Rhodothermaceae bacterium]|nr:hypothetical protein [Rhodothermaceae bacterium]
MSPSTPSRPTCRCGHDRYHHFARPSFKNGVGAWVAFFTGVSATPKEIAFACARCGETFEVTREPAVLRAYRRYPDISVDRP